MGVAAIYRNLSTDYQQCATSYYGGERIKNLLKWRGGAACGGRGVVLALFVSQRNFSVTGNTKCVSKCVSVGVS